MAYRIKDDCIICGACEPLCPVSAIELGDDIYEIDENVCVECEGFHDEPQCVAVCPVDVIFKPY
jgi:ferredoxin